VTYFVVVEDDHLQEEPLAEHLRSAFDGARVQTLSTEEEFRTRLPALRADIPDLVVMDVMLRWSDPRPDTPEPPEDVLAGGYYRAGLRCAQLMLDDPQLRHVPVVLYTILERNDLERDDQTLPPNATYVGKNVELDVLARHLRYCLRRRASGVPLRPVDRSENNTSDPRTSTTSI
jgi:CheY-like chemotaxis protein